MMVEEAMTSSLLGWVNVHSNDPAYGFEQVENFNFKQLQHQLASMETSVRLLGRSKDLQQPSIKPKKRIKLRPSTIQCLQRLSPRTRATQEALQAELTGKEGELGRHAKSRSEAQKKEVVEVCVKGEEQGELKVTLLGPFSILELKQAIIQELGRGAVKDVSCLLQGGTMTAFHRDEDWIRSYKKSSNFFVRGITLPVPAATDMPFLHRSLSPGPRSDWMLMQSWNVLDVQGGLSPTLSVGSQQDFVVINLPRETYSMVAEPQCFLLTPPVSPKVQVSWARVDEALHVTDCAFQEKEQRTLPSLPAFTQEREQGTLSFFPAPTLELATDEEPEDEDDEWSVV